MHGYRYHIRPSTPPTAVRITPMPNVISPLRCEGISKSLRRACTDDVVKVRIDRNLPLVVNPCEVGSKGQAAAYADACGRSCNRRGGIGDEDIPEVGISMAVVGDGFSAGGAVLDIWGGVSRGSWVCICPEVPVMRVQIAGGEVYIGASAGDVGHGDDGLSREVEVRDAGSEGTSGGEAYGLRFTGLAVAAIAAIATGAAIAATATITYIAVI
jgi:hypothetical protein